MPLDGPLGPPDALPPGYDQRAAVCSRHYGDAISAVLCAGNQPPSITSIAELEQLLDMNRNNSTLSITELSTGLGLHMVTPFNPNAILAKNIYPARYMLLAFARGELIANDSQTLRFFLIRFHPACEATGCNSADLC